ncbi:unnamed protein product, partial [Ectocarpus sp. 12 AP-2014]
STRPHPTFQQQLISRHTPHLLSKMVASQMFLGTTATLIASSTAFVAPMAVRSVAITPPSCSSLKMSAGSDYVATLPGAPFSDGKVRTRV